MAPEKKVVLTGIGSVTGNGISKKSLWDDVLSGKSGIKMITTFDVSNYYCKMAAVVTDFNPLDFVPQKNKKRFSKYDLFSLAAVELAIEDARLSNIIDNSNTGLIIGTSIGSTEEILNIQGKTVHPLHLFRCGWTSPNDTIALKYHLHGPDFTISSGSSSASNAIILATNMIESGVIDRCIVLGVDLPINEIIFQGFLKAKILANPSDKNNINNAIRPFDKDRSGTMIGEGAIALILENELIAQERNATIYASIGGWGSCTESLHMAHSDESGQYIASAMQKALDKAGLEASDIDYINTHGTGTISNDIAEASAIKTMFNPECVIGSTKQITGHLLGASGAVEGAISALSIYHSILPPHLNFSSAGSGCEGLNYSQNTATKANIDHVISLNHGFGGKDVAILYSKYH